MDSLIDTDRLTPWLAQHVPDMQPPYDVAKISGGQSNPTFALHAANGSFVLRRKPGGVLLKSAHAVDR
jgi:aminoglycoside phosphotransferase (APT) family kinase protein